MQMLITALSTRTPKEKGCKCHLPRVDKPTVVQPCWAAYLGSRKG